MVFLRKAGYPARPDTVDPVKGTFVRRMLLGALAVAAAAGGRPAPALGSGPARAAGQPAAAVSAHVVIVGISGLRWADISPSTTPALWAVARAGSPGSLVDFAVGPRTCPADAWLTLNGGDRAQVPHGERGLVPGGSGGDFRVRGGGCAGPGGCAGSGAGGGDAVAGDV